MSKPSSLIGFSFALSITALGASYSWAQTTVDEDTIRALVDRLELEQYKATIKGLTQFGDRRQGTTRNRMAVDWIQEQLESYGCPTGRIDYVFDPAPPSSHAHTPKRLKR